MHVDRMFGPIALEHGWVPSPRYLLRRARILALAHRMGSGDVLEIGCGAGMLLHEFVRRGFRCTAVESSQDALVMARTAALEAGVDIAFRERPDERWREKFDVVLAFEVLEHIEDDAAALESWRRWLRPGGMLLLSVPAHAKLWTAGDEWAGHYRRYERAALLGLLGAAGFDLERIECYGFPLANLTERVSARGYEKRVRRDVTYGEPDRRANNDRSGIDRGTHVRLYPLLSSLPGRAVMAGFLGIQRLFLSTELGTGYVLRARCR